MTDSIVVFRSRFLWLAKTIHETTDDYGQTKTIDLFDERLPDLKALRDLLVQRQRQPHCAVVSDAIIDSSRARALRRRTGNYERSHERSYASAVLTRQTVAQ